MKQIMSAGGSGENSTELQQTAEVTAGRRFCFTKCDGTFFFYGTNLKVLTSISSQKKRVKIHFENIVFPRHPWAADGEMEAL